MMVGKKLRQIRIRRKYTLRTLAKLTGLSHSFICDIEHERCNPSYKNLVLIANALSINPEFFFEQ